jgi:glycosyltransferase involved in cell wall biosynthesis
MTQKSIVYLGYSSFPYGLAEVQKMILISKALLHTDNKVTVICRNGTHKKLQYPELKAEDVFEGIEFIYASGSCFRNSNFFKRRVFEIKGKINEMGILIRMKKKGQLDYAILSTRKFSSILYYVMLSKIIGFKTILNYVEFYSAIRGDRFRIFRIIQNKALDSYAPRLVNAIFPISDFLIQHISKVAPGRKYFKIPVLTDFEKYKNINTSKTEPYFLFCGDVVYKEVVFFLINSYSLLKSNNSHRLYLVINGNREDIKQVENFILEKPDSHSIKLFSGLGETELYTLYKNSRALLIPLRPTLQDAARFPHKTGEYLASGNPVISTNYGEMKVYFRDRETMLLADEYDMTLFAQKMQFIIDHPEEARAIGENGKARAAELFDFKKIAPALNNFLKEIA